MRRKRYIFSGALVVCLVLALGGLPGAAHAGTTLRLRLIYAAGYSCVGPCSSATYFNARGTAHSSSPGFSTMVYALAGTVLSVNPNGCAVQSENGSLTTQDGQNTIFFSTTSDAICPTPNSNVLLETGTFTVTGGTGLFSTATGAGEFMSSVSVSPQVGGGSMKVTITY